MARAPDPRIKQAEEMFIAGKMLTEIAAAFGVPEGTVRSWKSRHWKNATQRNGIQDVAQDYATRHKIKRSAAKKSKKQAQKRKREAEACADEFAENSELTDQQMLFCIYYIKSFNAVKAYQKAYGCSYTSASRSACRLFNDPQIEDEIKKLKRDRLRRELLGAEDIVQKYIDIAFADMTDYVEFVGDNLLFKSSDSVDGTLISEISAGRIKLLDRMKALDWLVEHMDILTSEQKAKLELLKAQSDKLAREDGTTEEAADDGFLKALEGTAEKDWAENEEG